MNTATFHSDGNNEFDINEATAAAYASAFSSSQVSASGSVNHNDDPGSSVDTSDGVGDELAASSMAWADAGPVDYNGLPVTAEVTLTYNAPQDDWSTEYGLLVAAASAGLGAWLGSLAPSVSSAVTWGLWDSSTLMNLWTGSLSSEAYPNGLDWAYSNWVGIDPFDAPSWLDVAMGAGRVAGAAVDAASAGALGIADWQLFNVDVEVISDIYDELNPTIYDSPPLLGAPFSGSGATSGG